jgi:hypothetical protein
MNKKHAQNRGLLIKKLKKLDPSSEISDVSFKELSFPVQHADTLKKISYGFDIFSLICIIACNMIHPQAQKNIILTLLTLATSELIKVPLDPATKYTMSKKQAFEIAVLEKRLQKLQEKLSHETKTETPA